MLAKMSATVTEYVLQCWSRLFNDDTLMTKDTIRYNLGYQIFRYETKSVNLKMCHLKVEIEIFKICLKQA